MLKKLTLMFLLLTALFKVAVSAEKYAVLITGTCTGGSKEYWTDTFMMWEMLVMEKGYKPKNVFVIFNDGNDYFNLNITPSEPQRYMLFPRYKLLGYGQDDKIVNYSATKDNIAIVADRLVNEKNISDDDFLFVWTYDHGNSDGVSRSWILLK